MLLPINYDLVSGRIRGGGANVEDGLAANNYYPFQFRSSPVKSTYAGLGKYFIDRRIGAWKQANRPIVR